MTKEDLVVFVIDEGNPRGQRRIDALKGSIAGIIPNGRVSVVSCFYGDATVSLKPTSSVLESNRALASMKPSAMGNLAAGMTKALGVVDAALLSGRTKRATIAIIVDGKAHGLRSGPADCGPSDICDMDILFAATDIVNKANSLAMDPLPEGVPEQKRQSLKTVVVDTEFGKNIVHRPDGVTTSDTHVFSDAIGAKYFHEPSLDGNSLLRYVFCLHCLHIYCFFNSCSILIFS